MAKPPVDVDASSRLDLTHLPAIAIDDESTVEVDDAISVELVSEDKSEGGENVGGGGGPAAMRIWVHIADPSRYVARGELLDVEARQRGSTIYLPTGAIPMFPMSVASGPFSLRPGVVSCALSFGVRLDSEGAIDAAHAPIITPSLIRARRLTYDGVDEMLDVDPFAAMEEAHAAAGDADGSPSRSTDEEEQATLATLRRLEYVAQKRLSWRVAGGSIERVAPEGLPDVSIRAGRVASAPEGWDVSVRIGSSAAGGVARRIVTECMLLAGEAAARYGEHHGIPMAYRTQMVREELSDDEIADCPEGPCRAWLAIRQMLPSRVSEKPSAHEGLGLDSYVQVTSPIRRYADLALHYQLKAHLRGEPLPFPAGDEGTSTQKSQLLSLANEGGQQAKALERSANAYWLLEFLKRSAGQPLRATVLGKDTRNRDTYKLLLDDLGALVDCRSSQTLEIGSHHEVAPSQAGEFTL